MRIIVDRIETGWCKDSWTSVFDRDVLGVAELRARGRRVAIAPGVMAFLPPGREPEKMAVVASRDHLLDHERVAGLPFLDAATISEGVTVFYRRTLIARDNFPRSPGGSCLI